MLAQVPVVTESTPTFDPLGSDQVFGLGNAVFQTILAHAIDERWAFGVGARLVARAASDDLGNGKWQIMPGFGVRFNPRMGNGQLFRSSGALRNELCR